MSIELYGTEALGGLVLGLVRRVSRRLGLSEGVSLLLFLAVAFIGILGFMIYDSFAFNARLKNPRHTAFQQMVGGLGMGAIQSPKWCLHAFDPRTESICYAAAYPVPGSYGYCPYDTTVVTGFGELSKRTNFMVLGAPRRKNDG